MNYENIKTNIMATHYGYITTLDFEKNQEPVHILNHDAKKGYYATGITFIHEGNREHALTAYNASFEDKAALSEFLKEQLDRDEDITILSCREASDVQLVNNGYRFNVAGEEKYLVCNSDFGGGINDVYETFVDIGVGGAVAKFIVGAMNESEAVDATVDFCVLNARGYILSPQEIENGLCDEGEDYLTYAANNGYVCAGNEGYCIRLTSAPNVISQN